MKPASLTCLAISSPNRARTSIKGRLSLLALAAVCCLPAPGFATPFMWDQDGDGIDDRLESVADLGLNQAHEGGDPQGRLRFEASLVNTALQYGGYVRYDHSPTPADSLNAVLAGAQVVSTFHSVPYLRIRSSFASILLLSARPEVERIEAVTLMYSLNWKSERAMGVRSGAGQPFPAIEDLGGATGEGAVVAILDTGINDTPQGSFPGHADLAGRIVGGGTFDGPGPSGYTPYAGSVNPSQSSVGLTTYHATHVAGTVAGSPRDRVFGGVAPGARLVDVKVLGDDGSGYGLAEAVEWCIQNRDRAWGNSTGIDVINLSLSGTDASDGNDCACQLVNAAAAAGIIVVASAGNDGECGMQPAPAASDGAVTVGAVDVLDPGDPEDDVLAPFSNEGPRHDDQDMNPADEMKPDVVAPGIGIISSYGSPLTDGFGYRTLSGTSMSAAFVSGLAALCLEEAPGLTPAAFKTVLRETARHRTSATKGCSPGVDPLGLDSRYHAGWGYGVVDAFAAREELLHPGLTQFVRVRAAWTGTAVVVEWTTQRECTPAGFFVQRAPDTGGAPGTFMTVGDIVPAVGFNTLSTGNRTNYSAGDAAPAGQRFWYRVTTSGGGGAPDVSAAVPVWTETEAGRASATFVHNLAETEFVATIGVGLVPPVPLWSRPVDILNRLVAVSVDPLPASPNAITWTIELPLYAADGAGTYLPPAIEEPWWFSVIDGGDPARLGSLNAFSIETPQGTYVTDSTTPKLTVDGAATLLWIPEPAAAGAGRDPAPNPIAAFPNPFRSATRIQFHRRDAGSVRITIHDVTGREIRKIADRPFEAGEVTVTWDGRDATGEPAASGRYFVRILEASGASVLPLTLLR